jgi:hypothetical protein
VPYGLIRVTQGSSFWRSLRHRHSEGEVEAGVSSMLLAGGRARDVAGGRVATQSRDPHPASR